MSTETAQLVDEPAMRRAESHVTAVNRGDREHVLVVPPRLGTEADERPARKVVVHDVLGKVSPAEAAAEHRVLRREVGDTPRARREHGLVGRLVRAALREDDLNVLGEARGRRASLPARGERMLRAHDRDHADLGEDDSLEIVMRGHRGRDPERGTLFEHARADSGHRLGIDLEIDRGMRLRERCARLHQRGDGKDRIDAQRDLRLASAGKRGGQVPERIDLGEHPTRRDEDRLTFVGEGCDTSRSVPELHPEKVFERRHRRAHRGLHPSELSRRSREVPLLDGGDECAKVIERDRVLKHARTMARVRVAG